MPHNLSPEGKVICDRCTTVNDVKVINCPFKYCPPVALCPACSKAHPQLKTKAGHRANGCEQSAKDSIREQKERHAILESGDYLFSSSADVDDGLVHAVFRSRANRIGRFITRELLRLAESTANPTLKDFELWAGRDLPEAPADLYSVDFGPMLTVAAQQFHLKSDVSSPQTVTSRGDQARLFQ